MNKEEIVTYPIKIKRGIWEEWKKQVPREMNLNEAIVGLIERDIKE